LRKIGQSAGLPDGTFFKPKIQIWVYVFWRVLQWKMLVHYIYSNLFYLTAIWYILWSFDKFNGHLVYFSRFGTLQQEKSGNPCQFRPKSGSAKDRGSDFFSSPLFISTKLFLPPLNDF
jgi:hypothetical protein